LTGDLETLERSIRTRIGKVDMNRIAEKQWGKKLRVLEDENKDLTRELSEY